MGGVGDGGWTELAQAEQNPNSTSTQHNLNCSRAWHEKDFANLTPPTTETQLYYPKQQH